MIEPALYLFPVGLSDDAMTNQLPQVNKEMLKEVRWFVVENLRSARRSLKKVDRSIDIDSLNFTELSEHTRPEEIPAMLAPLERGEAIGVISEAGCPAVADPGADLVAEAQRRGIRVIPLVGPSSILLSLMASGFNGQRFSFEGYLPIDENQRSRRLREMIQRIQKERQTQILCETPYRNNRLIAELSQKLPGGMLLCVACDLTGSKESVITRPLSQWAREKYDYNKIPAIFLLYS